MASYPQQNQQPPTADDGQQPQDAAAAGAAAGAGAERNPYASASRWRHAESSAYARYEREHPHHTPSPALGGGGGPVAREADSRGGGVSDLADFLNKSRIDPSEVRAPSRGGALGPGGGGGGQDRPVTPRFKPVVAGATEARVATAAATGDPAASADDVGVDGAVGGGGGPPADGREIVCGPLLNYRRMEGERRWVGSVLVVTAGGGTTQPLVPRLELRRVNGGGNGHHGNGANGGGEGFKGTCLYSDSRNTFWRFDLAVDMDEVESRWAYELPGLRYASRTKPQVNHFHVPGVNESMRIMFHSCNGFSVGTDEEAYSGAALWNDVLRKHQERPFHVM